MEDLRDRIYEVVSHLKSARARDVAADILETVFEVASKDHEKGQVLVAFRGDGHRGFSMSADSLKRLEPGDKPGKGHVLLDATVDGERFEKALDDSRTIQDLAFQSGMRIRGNSKFIVAASRAINKRHFRIPAGEN